MHIEHGVPIITPLANVLTVIGVVVRLNVIGNFATNAKMLRGFAQNLPHQFLTKLTGKGCMKIEKKKS